MEVRFTRADDPLLIPAMFENGYFRRVLPGCAGAARASDGVREDGTARLPPFTPPRRESGYPFTTRSTKVETASI